MTRTPLDETGCEGYATHSYLDAHACLLSSLILPLREERIPTRALPANVQRDQTTPASVGETTILIY
jgi:hypothetical protein